jgi:hypothetical protein
MFALKEVMALSQGVGGNASSALTKCQSSSRSARRAVGTHQSGSVCCALRFRRTKCLNNQQVVSTFCIAHNVIPSY